MLNPMTDILETDEQKAKRLARETEMKSLLSKLPTREELAAVQDANREMGLPEDGDYGDK